MTDRQGPLSVNLEVVAVMVGYAPAWGRSQQGAAKRRASRLSAAEAGYDSFRVMKGIALGCALSVPAWVAIGLAVSALVS
jgi:hypothetical protein